jgi:hypothetical protein
MINIFTLLGNFVLTQTEFHPHTAGELCGNITGLAFGSIPAARSVGGLLSEQLITFWVVSYEENESISFVARMRYRRGSRLLAGLLGRGLLRRRAFSGGEVARDFREYAG